MGQACSQACSIHTLQVKLTIPKVEPADGCLSNLEKKLEKVLE
jgi:hypothetical protein